MSKYQALKEALAYATQTGGIGLTASVADLDALLADLERAEKALAAIAQQAPPVDRPIDPEVEINAAWSVIGAEQGSPRSVAFRDGAHWQRGQDTKSLSDTSAQQAQEPVAYPSIESLTDAISKALNLTWHCHRVWDAWHVGTMSEADFSPVDESDTPREIAEIVSALYTTPPAPQVPAKCLTCSGHGEIGGHMPDGSGHGEPCPACNAPQPAPVDELIEALEDLMDWQVKNVALWHNRAYDRAHRAIKKHRAALQSPAPQTKGHP